MVSGAIPLVSNNAFRSHFGKYADDFIFDFRDADDLAGKMLSLYKRSDLDKVRSEMSSYVRREFDITTVIGKIMKVW